MLDFPAAARLFRPALFPFMALSVAAAVTYASSPVPQVPFISSKSLDRVMFLKKGFLRPASINSLFVLSTRSITFSHTALGAVPGSLAREATPASISKSSCSRAAFVDRDLFSIPGNLVLPWIPDPIIFIGKLAYVKGS